MLRAPMDKLNIATVFASFDRIFGGRAPRLAAH